MTMPAPLSVVPVVRPNDLEIKRLNKLKSQFKEEFNQSVMYGIRAPGRINLIGEHIDYSGFGVLPMAIDKDIIMLINYQPSECFEIEFRNTDFKFKPQVVVDLNINASELSWINYVKAGLRGLLDRVGLPLGKVNVLVDSNLPSGAGLSSSSALVMCSILFADLFCKLYANNSKFIYNAPSLNELVQYAIKSEQFVGVKQGGMDQAISTYGKVNSACYVEFTPELKATPVELEFMSVGDPCFVVAHSNVRADKHVTAPIHYNLRVVETRVCAYLLGVTNLKEYYDNVGGFEQCLNDISIFPKDGYTLEQVYALLNMTPAQFKATFHPDFDIKCTTLALYKRALHVFQEAQRVLLAEKAKTIEEFGGLMNASQQSCRDLFDCSCDEINRLCDLAKSKGSRLTGAGWGGCTIHLIYKHELNDFLESIRPCYEGANMDELVFVTVPSMGACLIDFTTD